MNTGLTSFRALAFFAVFLFHIGHFRAGYLGVQAFFVLSGFLLTPILVNMKKDLGHRDYFVHFYGRRALRIFPLYYGYLFVVGVIALFIVNTQNYSGIERVDRFLDQLPWAITYTYNFFHASSIYEHTHLVTHFWSLAVEEQFYLFWPLLLFLVPSKNLNNILILMIILGPVLRLLTALACTYDPFNVINGRVDLVVYVLPLSHIDAFAAGGYFALYKNSKASALSWIMMFGVLILGYTTQFTSTGSVSVRSLGYPPFMNGKYLWGYSILNLFLAYLLVQIRDETFIPALFKNKWIRYIGRISYGLYVFHFPIIWVVYHYLSGYQAALASLLISIIVSSLSYEFFEKRILNYKDVLFSRKSANEALHSDGN